MNETILEIKKLNITDIRSNHTLLNDVSLSIQKYRTLAIVGESGSGKSLLSKAIMGLLSNTLAVTGSIHFQQNELLNYSPLQWRSLRGEKISLIVQNAMGAFDPLMTIGAQFFETLNCHMALPNDQLQQIITKAIYQVKLHQVHNLLDSYPYQLSGGQLQRVMIAFALALEPEIIIADEPTTALDAITQVEIIQQFKKLADQQISTLIFITHDLGLVHKIADDIAVMRNGQIIEYATKDQLLTAPEHEYTHFLLNTRNQLTARFKKIMRRHDVIDR